jgi:hypothetical protein
MVLERKLAIDTVAEHVVVAFGQVFARHMVEMGSMLMSS